MKGSIRRNLSLIFWSWVLVLMISILDGNANAVQYSLMKNVAAGYKNLEQDTSEDNADSNAQGLSSPPDVMARESQPLKGSETNLYSNDELLLDRKVFEGENSPKDLSGIEKVSERVGYFPHTSVSRETSQVFSENDIGNAPENDEKKPTGNRDHKSFEWLLKRVLGDRNLSSSYNSIDYISTTLEPSHQLSNPEQWNKSAPREIPIESPISITKNLSAEPQPIANSTLNTTFEAASLNLTNINITNNASRPLGSPTNPLPTKTPLTSVGATIVKVLFSILYVTGPTTGIFFVSPLYAIATRNLMDYFLGNPATVDLLHGAGILGLVVDLTWGAVE